MNDKLKWLTGSSFVGLIAVFALYGKGFFEALSAFPTLVAAFASNLPGGLKSYFLSLAIAGLFYSFVRRWLTCQHGARREFLSQLFALLLGIGITLAQQHATGKTSAPDLLQALLIGVLAGLSAPLTVQGLASLFAKPKATPASKDEP
jgi:hypothetical protein